jgi:hypothetical protein
MEIPVLFLALQLGAANRIFPVVKATLFIVAILPNLFFLGASHQTPDLTAFECYNN